MTPFSHAGNRGSTPLGDASFLPKISYSMWECGEMWDFIPRLFPAYLTPLLPLPVLVSHKCAKRVNLVYGR